MRFEGGDLSWTCVLSTRRHIPDFVELRAELQGEHEVDVCSTPCTHATVTASQSPLSFYTGITIDGQGERTNRKFGHSPPEKLVLDGAPACTGRATSVPAGLPRTTVTLLGAQL